uniref:Uncharacterized protein n=1 Tax=Magnetococcus massalia (strain MO-1) TaxID=451514 RepID=A0A1S7LPM0_MAGMO|nr:Protein of unknown function [Candidatus Magnetococcus massalia]
MRCLIDMENFTDNSVSLSSHDDLLADQHGVSREGLQKCKGLFCQMETTKQQRDADERGEPFDPLNGKLNTELAWSQPGGMRDRVLGGLEVYDNKQATKNQSNHAPIFEGDDPPLEGVYPESYLIPGGVGAKGAYKLFKGGKEIEVGRHIRVAPWGNRKNHYLGRFPHYHRRKFKSEAQKRRFEKGTSTKTARSQGIDRHRPWEKKPDDEVFFDRF